MKYSRLILALTCALSISCKAADISLKKDEVRCPVLVLKGQTMPSGAIVISEFPGSKKKLLSAGLISRLSKMMKILGRQK